MAAFAVAVARTHLGNRRAAKQIRVVFEVQSWVNPRCHLAALGIDRQPRWLTPKADERNWKSQALGMRAKRNWPGGVRCRARWESTRSARQERIQN